MPKLDGEFDGYEYWSRCPYCGDSNRHTDRAHYSANMMTGKFYCYRCGVGGMLEPGEMVQLLNGMDLRQVPIARSVSPEDPLHEIRSRLQQGSGLTRYSALDRFHFQTGQGDVDVFESKTPSGNITGYHMRASWDKIALTYGEKLLGYRGNSLKTSWVRLVEGPYDALDPQHDVVTFGFPTPKQLRMLLGYPLVLCPDGDVWQDRGKLWSYFSQFRKVLGLIIDKVEYIPDGKDPDEVPPHLRTIVTYSEVVQGLQSLKKRPSPRYLLPNQVLDQLSMEVY